MSLLLYMYTVTQELEKFLNHFVTVIYFNINTLSILFINMSILHVIIYTLCLK